MIRISAFEAEKHCQSCARIVTTINIITYFSYPNRMPTHKQIVRVRKIATNSEEFHKVIELAVDIPTHCYGTSDNLNIVFLSNDFLGLQCTKLNKYTLSHNSISTLAGSNSRLRSFSNCSSMLSDTGSIGFNVFSSGRASIFK